MSESRSQQETFAEEKPKTQPMLSKKERKIQADLAAQEKGWVCCGRTPPAAGSSLPTSPCLKYHRGLRPADKDLICDKCKHFTVNDSRLPEACSDCYDVILFPYGADKLEMVERIVEIPTDDEEPSWNYVCLRCMTWGCLCDFPDPGYFKLALVVE
ncbi:hypothetical protein HBH56_155760 [Parastagonospora nodorum]|uniref:Uncharacterized protein n=1 Tax=Phaeosphaeria nodorum (strain SN15 / ATCC MYA-4574 / FGSC 10173) TaxID=321614 RepID=A0A7U2HZ80_PHANO|nr:hypothetical protein HBH56_155760 [Parastagonospora nodorum]QRC95834.1 hypothetical protein JI435_303850 [Parastagonospora nodorum SN15]KAH3926771.1 hypothetical protein HBH54_161910 [Parastagonospora nodorum]KAH3970239.1 hypothetical protein HBH52_168950 [Parastagonospora nodorum]KAH3972203.1 hypothetical protein HBH51_104250 [Parastagonospora nodorum]